MSRLPEYVGPMAIGLKMGVILPGMQIIDKVFDRLVDCCRDDLLEDGDIIAITESVVARAQNNYVTTADIAREVKNKLRLPDKGRVAVVFPIASRNRFAMILQGIAEAVPGGEVVVQFSFPCDEVGNQVVSADFCKDLNRDLISAGDLEGSDFKHPITGVNYIRLYREIIEAAGARPVIYLCNDPARVVEYEPDGVIAANIHNRAKTRQAIKEVFDNCVSLDELCTTGEASSEWGLLGSNMSACGKLKLAPRDGERLVRELQRRLKEELGVSAEVLIYGDGAYRDPTTGIYELADPKTTFAATDGLNAFREGIKLKYLADLYYYEHGKCASEIEQILAEEKKRSSSADSMIKEGTTPRRLEDVLASLADLVSGSADAGTPVVLIKGFLS